MSRLDLDDNAEEEANEEEDQFVASPVTRSESSFVLKCRVSSDPNTPVEEDNSLQSPFPILLRRANTVSSAEFRKRQSKLRFFPRRKKPQPQLLMADSPSQLALFHHLRGNALIKQVCYFSNKPSILSIKC